MATRRYHAAQRSLGAWEGFWRALWRLLIVWPLKITLILLLLLFRRKSLALWLWGKGRVMRWARVRSKAYNKKLWEQTRRPVYRRNKNDLGEGEYFVCEQTGYMSLDLGDFHVDHRLARSWFPFLAHKQWNLRLVRADVNMAKGDKLPIKCFLIFIFRGRL